MRIKRRNVTLVGISILAVLTAVLAVLQRPTTAPSTLASNPASASKSLGTFKSMTHGVTGEGFYFLGDPSAAATLIDYSDFL